MGSVIVRVGCPHRLRQPITERTGTPCPECAVFGPPGWPREAWAMTVDYGPRLSEAATAAPAPIPAPTVKMPPEVAAVFAATRMIAERAAEALTPLQAAIGDLSSRMMEAQIVSGPIAFTSEPEHNAIRVRMQQEHQLRMRRIARGLGE